MKLRRKIRHNKKVCLAQDFCEANNQVRGQIVPKWCLSNNLEITEANLLKLHKKIKHNDNVCHL